MKSCILSIGEGVKGSHEAGRRQAGLRVSAFSPSEEQDVRLWSVEFVVAPAARLLDADSAPFLDRKSVTDSVRRRLRGIFL